MIGWTRNSRNADSRIVEAKSSIERRGGPGRAAKRGIVARASQPTRGSARPDAALALLAEQPDEHADHDRHHDRGGERKEEGEVLALDREITGQPAEGQPGEPWPREARDEQRQADDDQGTLHGSVAASRARVSRAPAPCARRRPPSQPSSPWS